MMSSPEEQPEDFIYTMLYRDLVRQTGIGTRILLRPGGRYAPRCQHRG